MFFKLPNTRLPLLSVIVVSYNTREKTLRCLSALYSDLSGADAEVFVIDNASTDGSADAIEIQFPMVNIIRSERNLGFAAANNRAIRKSNGDRILLLNSDAYLRSGSIAALTLFLNTQPNAAAVGPRLLNLDGSLQPSCFKFPGPGRSVLDFLLLTAARPNHPTIGDYRLWAHDENRLVDFVTGASLMIRRSALDAVGLLDENFFFYFEEADWCLRATNAGWKIGFTPNAEVIHEGGGSGKTQSEEVFNEFQLGHERLIRKHYGATAVLIHRVSLALGAILRVAIFGTRQFLLRKDDSELVQKWGRILSWCLGRKGPALSSTFPGAMKSL